MHHKVFPSDNVAFTFPRLQDHYLSRRYSDNAPVKRAPLESGGRNVQAPGVPGIYNQPAEVSPHSNSGDSIPRLCGRLKVDEAFPPTGQSTEHYPGMPSTTNTRANLCAVTVSSAGQDGCRITRSTVSSFEVPKPSTTQDQCAQKVQVIRNTSDIGPGSPRGPAMVGKPSTQMEWQGNHPADCRCGD